MSVLTLLEKNRGHTVSGEQIAGSLSLSRNAVWKAVSELRKDGYRIDSTASKGYSLAEDNDIMSAQGMAPYLSRRTPASDIHLYPVLESTNKTAKEQAIAGAPHGTIIIAETQTAGRGRYGRSFFSPPGCAVYMSFVFKPVGLWASTPTIITSAAAVSVCEAVETATGKKPEIKWVNDVFLDGKKICGILTEAVTDFESGRIEWMVVGIGVNFITPPGGFGEGLSQAGAVFADEPPSTTRNRLAAEIANRMTGFEAQPNARKMLSKYKKRMMMLGKRIMVMGGAPAEGEDAPVPSYEATAVDIDDIGRLIVKTDDGARHTLSFGEISIRV